jgi:uncharacterized delta-60 repeat protein
MTRPLALALLCLAALALAAAPASAAVAPGRIAFSIAANVPESNVDAGGAETAVALPDGGAVVVAHDRKGFTAARLRADGSLEPTFGNRGIARIALPGGQLFPAQLLRQPDGRLLVVGAGTAASRYELPRSLLVRLTAAGAPDPSFGTGGVAAPELQAGSAALAPDGSIVLTGNTGQTTPTINPSPNQPTTFQWVVQRLTPAGTPDASFGTVPMPGQTSSAVVVRPDGAIVALGNDRGVSRLAGLTAGGVPDLAFDGRLPAALPDGGSQMLLHTNGAIDVLGNTVLSRVTPAGAPDAAFGAGGNVAFGGPLSLSPEMLAAPDGGTAVYWAPFSTPTRPGQARLRVLRITRTGTLGAAVDLAPGFGGGVTGGALTRISVAQNAFRVTRLLARPDGSYLAAGGLSVQRYTGEGEGFSTGLVAVAGLTPLLAPDTSFGGPQQAAYARVRVQRQRARSDARLGRVLARVTASGPGLVQLRVRDGHRRILAQGIEPVYAAGTSTVRIALTKVGRRVLRRARNMRVIVGHDFRDVLTGRDRDAIAARLR